MAVAIFLEDSGGRPNASVVDLDPSRFPTADVTLRVEFSSLNYKDALAIVHGAPVVRQWPMVPGIDGAGTVDSSTDPRWQPGDRVLLNGWGVGEAHWGCLAQLARVKGDWLVPLPESLDSRTAMALGTAGYTAMLCVMRLQQHGITPGDGDVLVTGAAGGVGSTAIRLLAQLGFRVIASTGRASQADYLKRLGAAEVIDRGTLSQPGKPLGRERWVAAIDSVGSHTLVNACAATRYGGIVAACGLAQGMDLPGSVAPFILRGITLAGVDSVMAARELRMRAWQRLAAEMDRDALALIAHEVSLAGALEAAPRLLRGEVRGRIVVNVQA